MHVNLEWSYDWLFIKNKAISRLFVNVFKLLFYVNVKILIHRSRPGVGTGIPILWDPSPNPKFWDWDWDWDRFFRILGLGLGSHGIGIPVPTPGLYGLECRSIIFLLWKKSENSVFRQNCQKLSDFNKMDQR